MARTFYVDARLGSDANAGTSASSAFASLDKVNSLNLQPGDTVLFARGSSFNGALANQSSGNSGTPITYGAYGTGADPVIGGGGIGVDVGSKHDIVLQNLQIQNVGGTGIYASGASNVTVDHVTFSNIGDCAIQFWHSKNMSVSNSTAANVTADTFLFWDVDGLKVLNNTLHVPHGSSADNMHIQQLRNYEIRGNAFLFDGPTDSGKGNILLGNSENGVIANNTFNGGNYAIGFDSANTVVENNYFANHTSAQWSAAINMGAGQADTIAFRNNFFENELRGFSLFELTGEWAETPVIRDNMTISGNIFKAVGSLFDSDGNATYSGSFNGNTIVGSNALPWSGGNFSVSGNTYTSTVPNWSGGAGSYKPVEVIAGTDGKDNLVGTDGNDIIWGDRQQDGPAGGDDILRGGKGDDYLSGGPGSDIFVGERGGGMDTIRWFEAGKDKIDVTLFGWKSLTEMQAAGVTMITGSEGGVPTLTIGFGSGDGFKAYGVGSLAAADFVFATSSGGGTTPPPNPTPAPAPTPSPTPSPTPIVGTAGNDKLVGTDGADTIWGDPLQDGPTGGNDIIRGGKGNDYLSGGAGNDTYVGEHGGGMDTIRWFEGGKDKIDVTLFGWHSLTEMQAAGVTMTAGSEAGGVPALTLNFGGGDGFKVIGVGALSATDFLFATSSGGGGTTTPPTSNNTITGTAGNDKLTGADNVNDLIDGKDGHDTLYGLSGDDKLVGGGGNDQLYGGSGNDILLGGTGSDQLFGEAGNDRLDGGPGNDVLTGGAGNDVFTFAKGGGSDLIKDFAAGQDKIDLSAFGLGDMTKLAASANIVSTGTNTMYIDFGAGDRLTIYGVGKLAADNVIF